MPYSLKLLLIGLLTILTGLAVIVSAPFDRTGKLAYRLSTLWTWGIFKIGGIRVKVRGLEGLNPRRPYVFIANHQSYIDIPVLIKALPGFQLRWIAKKELLRVPLFGWAMWSAKHIIVDRFNLSKAKASLKKAEQRIREGLSVVIFPEGTRSSDGKLLPFKRGGFVLAVKTRTPVAPVTIAGSGAVLPRGDWRIREGEIEVVVSEPVAVDPYRAGHTRELVSRVRSEMEAGGENTARPQSEMVSDARTRAAMANPALETG